LLLDVFLHLQIIQKVKVKKLSRRKTERISVISIVRNENKSSSVAMSLL